MPKRKLQRFNELLTMERVFEFPFPKVHTDHGLKGNWRSKVFKNDHPVIAELGCGRGEYTVGLARAYPEKNFIGVDIKGARLWRGAKTINEENLLNGAFLRIHIEWLQSFFENGELDEIWITFPDPQPLQTRVNRRLTNPKFIAMYRQLLKVNGVLHLKTDNRDLFEYTLEVLSTEKGMMEVMTFDLYKDKPEGFNLDIRTTYEEIFLKKGMTINYLRFRMENRGAEAD